MNSVLVTTSIVVFSYIASLIIWNFFHNESAMYLTLLGSWIFSVIALWLIGEFD